MWILRYPTAAIQSWTPNCGGYFMDRARCKFSGIRSICRFEGFLRAPGADNKREGWGDIVVQVQEQIDAITNSTPAFSSSSD